MVTKSPTVDRSRDMEEKAWWDLWNTSYRAKESNDAVSGELFERVAVAVNRITGAGSCRVLEIACGTGTLSRMIAFSRYHGIDISPAAIGIARERSDETLVPRDAAPPTYEAVDLHEWPLPGEPFDLAVCVDAISSIRDQSAALKKIAASLRPGGWLVLTTINRFVYDRIQRTASVRLESGPVSRWLTRPELEGLVRGAGFVIERSTTIMPRGNLGILRWVNSYRLNTAFGPRAAAMIRRLKERCGLGQYSFVVARKAS